MVTHCEIDTKSGLVCEEAVTGWCRVCDRATCDEHRQVSFHGPERYERCRTCAEAAAQAQLATEAAYREALDDIRDSIRALRTRNCAATRLATTRARRTPLLRPWARKSEPLYSIRYWPVGRFAWLQSCPGGFGEHEIMSLGVSDYETVVNERGQITRLDQDEIVAGRAVLAQLLSEPAATVTIAAKLRGYLQQAELGSD